MATISSPNDYAVALLIALGAPQSTNNIQQLVAWQNKEGQWGASGSFNAQSQHNPLNIEITSWQTFVSGNPTYASYQVQDLVDSNGNHTMAFLGGWSQGIAGCAAWMQAEQGGIVSALRASDQQAFFNAVGGWLGGGPTADAAYAQGIGSLMGVPVTVNTAAIAQPNGATASIAPSMLPPTTALTQGAPGVVSPTPLPSYNFRPTRYGTLQTPGFGELSVGSITINGGGLSVDVANAVQDIIVERSIGGASTVTVQLQDPQRTLLRSNLFSYGDILMLDGLRFIMVQMVKSGDEIELIFEAAGVALLRQTYGQLASTSSTDITAFCYYLVQEVNQKYNAGMGFVGQASGPNSPYQNGQGVSYAPNLIIGRGTSSDVLEDSWTAMVRMVTTAGWMIFESDNTIYMGPDQFFLTGGATGPVQGPISEFTDEVQNIDVSWSYGQPYGDLTVTATTQLWAFPPGTPVTTLGMGAPIDYTVDPTTKKQTQTIWLVKDMQRDLYTPQGQITLMTPMTPVQAIETASGYTSSVVPFSLSQGNPAAGTPDVSVGIYGGTSSTSAPTATLQAGQTFTVVCNVSGGGLGETPTGTVQFLGAQVQAGGAVGTATPIAGGNAVPLDATGTATLTVTNGWGPGPKPLYQYQITCIYNPAKSDRGAPGGKQGWLQATSSPVDITVGAPGGGG